MSLLRFACVLLCMLVSSTAYAHVTLDAVTPTDAHARPGYGVNLTYTWHLDPDDPPIDHDYAAFVLIRPIDGGDIIFQGDHAFPIPPTLWHERLDDDTFTYERMLVVPTDTPPGEYRIIAGMWNAEAKRNGPVVPGDNATVYEDWAIDVGMLTIAPDAPIPPLPEPTLDLTGYELTFDESFDQPLDVSTWNQPAARWFAHTPYGGDFGDAPFADPGPNTPFAIHDGTLHITVRRNEQGQWRAGLLSSLNPDGEGFTQQYGYFEARMKLPPGKGVWPAFWLLGAPRLTDDRIDQIEIDVIEQWGIHPNALHNTTHIWYADGRHWSDNTVTMIDTMTTQFHDYGVLVTPDTITYYLDGRPVREEPTPDEAHVPLYLLVDLAIGGGWPIDETPDPSVLEVEHIRVYQSPANGD